MSNLTVQHADTGSKGVFFIRQDGERAAAMTYTKAGDSMIIVDHTEVGESLAGQGAGLLMLQTLVQWARDNAVEVMATCPFALAQFRRHEELRDVYVGT